VCVCVCEWVCMYQYIIYHLISLQLSLSLINIYTFKCTYMHTDRQKDIQSYMYMYRCMYLCMHVKINKYKNINIFRHSVCEYIITLLRTYRSKPLPVFPIIFWRKYLTILRNNKNSRNAVNESRLVISKPFLRTSYVTFTFFLELDVCVYQLIYSYRISDRKLVVRSF
jgi:hypothetical protein